MTRTPFIKSAPKKSEFGHPQTERPACAKSSKYKRGLAMGKNSTGVSLQCTEKVNDKKGGKMARKRSNDLSEKSTKRRSSNKPYRKVSIEALRDRYFKYKTASENNLRKYETASQRYERVVEELSRRGELDKVIGS